MPNGISGNWKKTCSAATIRSQAMTSSNPPPIASPLTAPITGLLRFHISVNPANPPGRSASASHQLSNCCSPASNALRSHPAENIFSPLAVTRPTRSSGSSRSMTTASLILRLKSKSIAFTLGRLSAISNTAPCRSTSSSCALWSICFPGFDWFGLQSE